MKKNGVLILDFGSQYTKLIARRVREENIYSQIVSHDISLSDVLDNQPAALILSGGPSSVFDKNALKTDPKILELEIPIFGICYGLQLLAHSYGGIVEENNFMTSSSSETVISFSLSGESIKLNKLPQKLMTLSMDDIAGPICLKDIYASSPTGIKMNINFKNSSCLSSSE